MSKSARRRGEGVERSAVGALLGRAGRGLDGLEARQHLSLEALPQGAAWSTWGGHDIATVAGSYIVTFDDYMGKDNAELMARDVARALGVEGSDFRAIGRGAWATFRTEGSITLERARAVWEGLGGVKWVEPETVFKTAQTTPNDPFFGQQYTHSNSGQSISGLGVGTTDADFDTDLAWDTTIGSRDVIVGVIDTGVDITHPDLAQNIWRNPLEIAGDGIDNDNNGFIDDVTGFDFGELDSDPSDVFGHGTNVAGVIGAVGNNGIGVAGVAWNVSILPLKIADRFGGLSNSAIIGAHDYVTMMIGRGVHIVATNNSYGGYAPAFFLDLPETGLGAQKDAIERYLNAGGVFVAAAGNDGFNNDNPDVISYPDSFNLPGIISAAATDNNDALANFSNFGVQKVDVAAPGVQVLTTVVGGGYAYVSGTSFASPNVAGVVALLKTVKPNASAVEIREILINSSDPHPSLQGKVTSGGRVNAARALEIAGIDGPVLRAINPGPVTTQLDPTTGQPIRSLTVTFSETIDNNAAFFNTTAVEVIGDGADNSLGTADDNVIPIQSITRSASDGRVATVQLDLSGFALQRLPIDTYRLTLSAGGFRDLSGNFLNGNTGAGEDEITNFRIAPNTGDNESNDTLALATAVVFDASGTAFFGGATIGNGLSGLLDVDMYRVHVDKGAQLTVEVIAQRQTAGSNLDSYLRLFDASGNQLAFNDQFFGNDSLIDFFLNTAGDYYIGVSGFGNAEYAPTLPGSGSSQSAGTYSLRLTAELEQDDVVEYTNASNRLPGQPAILNIPRGDEPNPPTGTQGTTTAGIVVDDTREVIDINVRLNIAHTAVGDLTISLLAPDGREVILFNRRGGDGNNLGTRDAGGAITGYTIFDDEGLVAISAGTPPYVGTFRPEGALGVLDGIAGNGTWTLKVVDGKPLDNGQLIDWSITLTFSNDIFGPFESNETLVTASAISEITGTGTATRTAFLGDGGFGLRDRDIYRLSVEAGTSLTARVQPVSITTGTPAGEAPAPAPVFNSALRLFDATGAEILISNPSATLESAIANFVFVTAGTYYLGVSETANLSYNPSVVGSGQEAGTTGNYTLTISVVAGVSDPAIVLQGTSVAAGLNTSGVFFGPLNTLTNASLRFQGIEFLPQTGGRPSLFMGGIVDDFGFVNTGPTGTNDLPFSITDLSDQTNNRATSKAKFRGLEIERTMSFADGDNFVAIDIRLSNTTGAAMSDVAWTEGFNPDPGISLGDGVQTTFLDVDASGRVATARYVNNQYQDGLFVAMIAMPGSTAVTPRANILTTDFVVRDPRQVFAQPVTDPEGGVSDGRLSLTFALTNDLPVGSSVTLRYFLVFGTKTDGKVSTDGAANTVLAGHGDMLDSAFNTLSNGSGAGFLTFSTSTPATETLSNGQSVPQLPFRYYYPEGFNGPDIFNFLPMANPNNDAARVVVIQHFEAVPAAKRDRLAADFSIPGLARRGVDLNLPGTFAAGTFPDGTPMDADYVRKPYAVEIRSDRPIAPTFSYYDLVQIPSGPVAVGESFTTVAQAQWSFANVEKKDVSGSTKDINSFIIFQNPDKVTTAKVNVWVYGKYTDAGGTLRDGVWVSPRLVDPWGRSGLFLSATDSFDFQGDVGENFGPIPDGVFAVFVDSDVPIVAARTTYNPELRQASGAVGNAGNGATTGVIGEGQFGIRNSESTLNSETIGVVNTTAAAAQVVFSFIFANGSTVRTSLAVPSNTSRTLEVESVPNFPSGQAYGVYYESNVPVSMSLTSPLFDTFTNAFGDTRSVNDAFSITSSQQAYSYWGFGEGFRPGDSTDWDPAAGLQRHPGVFEHLRIYNPSSSDVTIEVTLNFDLEPGTETFRRVIPGRRVVEFGVEEFINAGRRARDQSYGIFIKAPSPIVAAMDHYDRLFPGAFATLGTPLGRVSPVT